MRENRVVVTGMGVVAPNGIGLDAFWDSLINCKSGVDYITRFDTSDFPVKIAGEVKNFDLRDYFPNSKFKRFSRQTQLALLACKMAINNAGLSDESLRKSEPLSVVLGIASSGADVIAPITLAPVDRVRPYLLGASPPSATVSAILSLLNVRGVVTTVSNACPSGLDAIGIATKMIREGRTDRVLVGAADSPINATAVAGFSATNVLSVETDCPPEVSRPFDRKRSGVVLAEGAGFLLLERLDSALARGASFLVEVLGSASMMDAPYKECMNGLAEAMALTMDDAGIYPEDVGYICANALSDLEKDRIEAQAIRKVFGCATKKVPVSSIRGVMGHPLAPAGIFQAITCILSIMHQMIPPTANLREPDPDCDLDHVLSISRKANVKISLANAHGVSGENSALIMKRIE